jgi:simple sugar transport system ATP-binding protein
MRGALKIVLTTPTTPPVGDRFVVLHRGRLLGARDRAGISRDELVKMVAGGQELGQPTHELVRK